tara:strand:- start:224 stop:667 length:444 start_codon:yes stop_codon:yes gene_type:complete
VSAQLLPDIDLPDDLPPLVKPGVYDLAFVDYRTAMMFMGKAPKLVMTFRIVTMGEFFEVELQRYYNVKRIYGKPQRYGRFKPSSRGAFLREYLTLFSGMGSRIDRIPMSKFENALIEGKVETVTRSQGKDIPKELQYSVIKELRSVK